MSSSSRSKTPSTHGAPEQLQRKHRALIACTKCRRRKIKCVQAYSESNETAGTQPCSYCTKNGYQCEYVPVDAEGSSPPSSPGYPLHHAPPPEDSRHHIPRATHYSHSLSDISMFPHRTSSHTRRSQDVCDLEYPHQTHNMVPANETYRRMEAIHRNQYWHPGYSSAHSTPFMESDMPQSSDATSYYAHERQSSHSGIDHGHPQHMDNAAFSSSYDDPALVYEAGTVHSYASIQCACGRSDCFACVHGHGAY